MLVTILVAGCSTSGPANSGESTTPRAGSPAVAAKILVAEDGIYAITSADLQAAGLSWTDVDPLELQLRHRGEVLPLWVHEQDAGAFALHFYGQASQSRYVRENVYWLDVGAGKTGKTHKIGPPATADDAAARGALERDYLASAHVEENKLYAPQAEVEEPWFWTSLPAPRTQTFDVELPDVAAGEQQTGELRLALWSSTEAPATPDHHLRISVNGQRVADDAWDGRGRHLIEPALPADLLRTGHNAITVEAPGDTGVAADVTFVDWIELRYPRRLTAAGDELAFESSGTPQRLTGFKYPVTIFDVTAPTNPALTSRLTPDTTAGTDSAVAFDGQRGHRYVAIGEAGGRRAAQIVPVFPQPDLRASTNGADYVAVGPADLLEPLQPLLSRREAQGLKVKSLPVDVIYDQFNAGLPEPDAIRRFLRHAAEAWTPTPKYLLLVGDASYDPRGYVTPAEANRLPTFFVRTIFGGETASDVRFAQLDDDGRPDLAVGRMPARTPDRIRTLVEKTLAYEQSGGAWQHRALAVADGQSPTFRADAQAFLDQFPADYQTTLVAPEAGASDASRQVKQHLDAGNLLVAYFGHGSITQWGKDNILTTADAQTLSDDEGLPVVLNFTCLTGLFTHPTVASLAEELLWQPQGGAVATLAPTSLTLPTDQSFLSTALLKAMIAGSNATLGQMLLAAQRQMPTDTAGVQDVMQTFLLFGDPALVLNVPGERSNPGAP